ncbi:MAG: hydroxymethylbilane synthase [Candidatus Melainabacteria bacterium RIFOXYA2_FULL_32_9]|nr:MAG: hydroxymethylbilane synthase [Candidatus Melainabacteria bacterium RIFOXYA2_FULL_32_9]
MKKITVGTRGSKLALTQTGMVIDDLKKAHPGLKVDIKIITTTGDKILDKELSKIGGKGLFIKEIEEALLAKEIDFAVHSMKDVPHTLPEEFQIGAILKREDPRDVLICRDNYDLNNLPAGARIGTGSLRRMLQLKALRSDLVFLPIRGNIDTRVGKLARNEFDAIVLAAAGLKRMGWQGNDEFLKTFLKEESNIDFNVSYLELDKYIPSVGQGALAIELRKNDQETFNIVKVLHHEIDAKCVLAERAFLKEVDGGCEIPIGAHCKAEGNQITIDGFVGDEEKNEIYRDKLIGNIDDYDKLGTQLAKNVLNLQKNSQ